jgi:osmoprotectant transport system permease protein
MATGRPDVSLFGDALSWLGDGKNWQGSNGILQLTVAHLKVTGLALGIAGAVALPVGVGFGHRRRGGRVVTVIANAGRAVPPLALIIILASEPSFGVNTRTAVVALAVFAIPPILVNAYTGVREVEPDTLDAARGLGMNGRQILTRVELPLALPLLATGIRIAVIQTFATATLASYAGTRTLGTIIQINQASENEAAVLAAALVIAVEALILDVLLSRVQVAVRPGPRRTRRPLRRRPGWPFHWDPATAPTGPTEPTGRSPLASRG